MVKKIENRKEIRMLACQLLTQKGFANGIILGFVVLAYLQYFVRNQQGLLKK